MKSAQGCYNNGQQITHDSIAKCMSFSMILFLVCWLEHKILYNQSKIQVSFLLLFSREPLIRYVKVWVAHAPGRPGTFSLSPRVNDHDMHHRSMRDARTLLHLGSLTSGFLWSRWRGKRSRHSRRMCNPQFYVSGTRPVAKISLWLAIIHVI